jgi:hypothetical protein
MQFIVAERTVFVPQRAIMFARWLAESASRAFALGGELLAFEVLILPFLNRLSTFGHPAAPSRSGRRCKAATKA